jgi:NTP pyrophosphatase (non-canonical NTP hydrolase)
MNDKLLKIIEHYEITNQLKKLNEECYELIEAIRDYEEDLIRVDCDDYYTQHLKKHIEEEFADVMVLLGQIKYFYDLDDEKIKKIMNEKIDRQLDRIQKGI